MNISLEKWETLERRYAELTGIDKKDKGLAKTLNMTLGMGPVTVTVKQISEPIPGWEVTYHGSITILYIGIDAEERANELADQLRQASPAVEENARACQLFLDSCIDWPRYDTYWNREKLVNALMKVRPLDVNKIWVVFRKLIEEGELLPKPHIS